MGSRRAGGVFSSIGCVGWVDVRGEARLEGARRARRELEGARRGPKGPGGGRVGSSSGRARVDFSVGPTSSLPKFGIFVSFLAKFGNYAQGSFWSLCVYVTCHTLETRERSHPLSCGEFFSLALKSATCHATAENMKKSARPITVHALAVGMRRGARQQCDGAARVDVPAGGAASFGSLRKASY